MAQLPDDPQLFEANPNGARAGENYFASTRPRRIKWTFLVKKMVGIRVAVGLAGLLMGTAMFMSIVPVAVAVEAQTFGIAKFTMQTTRVKAVALGPSPAGLGFENEPYVFAQAGGHPFALTSTLEFTSTEHNLKDMIIDLPPGLLANPLAVSRCPLQLATTGRPCPVNSQVGVFVLNFEGKSVLGPIVDLTPEAGQSAELGLETPFNITFVLTGHVVRMPNGYGLALVGNGFPSLSIAGVEATLWGVPAASVYDPQRGLSCFTDVNREWRCEGGGLSSGDEPLPFLTMPTDCAAGPQSAIALVDSWEEPGKYMKGQSTLPAMTGCNLLPFDPDIEVKPDTLLADEPVGMGINIADQQNEDPQSVATPPLRDATLTLPQGVSINPGIADGVQACEPTGPEGIDIPTGLDGSGEPLEPGEPGEGEEVALNGEARLVSGHCPAASTVGSAEALTPLLPNPIKGRVYLGMPGCGGPGLEPCTEKDAIDGNLYRLYVELGGNGDPREEGVNIKIEGKVEANPGTGQLTIRLTENPQLPLSKLSIALNGGPRALLDGPATCGPARTTSDLRPWSATGTTPAPESLLMPGTPDANPSSFYDVTDCVNPPVLIPGMIAGTLSPQAGAFSAFTFTVTRSDREPYLSAFQLHTPPGLSAMLASVPLCQEELANTGGCAATSRIGSTLVAAGGGSHPIEMPGRMYLTAGYKGGPFGLSIVTDAVAGPFNLGRIVVRARIDIDPETSSLTIVSDPLPQVVLGIPLRLQRVTFNIDRPDFIFNPTNCSAQSITTMIVGTQGVPAEASSPFVAAGCRSLTFKPRIRVSTDAHTSFAGGASLDMKLALPSTEQGREANLAKVKIELPKQLPVRLTTLQSACANATFNADPAECSKASIIGIARARTPVLPVELIGPVYLVAHGHQMLPSPVVVLQGYGIRLDLPGTTTIDRTGVASIAFDSIPDLPIDSFELYLPRGGHSILGTSGGLCSTTKTVVGRTLTSRTRSSTIRRRIDVRRGVSMSRMPVELVAQNGALIHRNARIMVVGCTSGKAQTDQRLPRQQPK